MKKNTVKTLCKGLVCTFVISLSALGQLRAQSTESQKTETVNGKTYIIHKIKSQDTYYQLSRVYGVPVNDIMKANNKKNLRVGDTARVPAKDLPPVEENKKTIAGNKTTPGPATATPTNIADEAHVLTEYKIGNNETLYSIAQRFQTTVNDIKKLNNLSSDIVREGQLIKIPDGELPTPEPVKPVEVAPIVTTPVETSKDLTARDFDGSRYGIREKTEKGIGVWMDNLETRNNSNLALHKTAPVGTVLKITNPITKSVTYAKVVGKFSDNTETHDAIVVLSKSAAAYIGAVDKRFIIEIAYGAPVQ